MFKMEEGEGSNVKRKKEGKEKRSKNKNISNIKKSWKKKKEVL